MAAFAQSLNQLPPFLRLKLGYSRPKPDMVAELDEADEFVVPILVPNTDLKTI